MSVVPGRVSHRIGSLSVRTKILAVLLIATAVSAVVGSAALVQTNQVAAQGRSIYNDALLPNGQLADLRETVVQARFDVLSRANSKTPDAYKVADANMKADDAKIAQLTVSYGAAKLDARQRADLATFHTAWLAYVNVRDNEMTPALARGDIAAYEKFRITELVPLVGKILGTLNSLSAQATSIAAGHLTKAETAQRTAREVVAILLVVGLALALLMAAGTARAIIRPLRRIRDVLDAVAQDDLTRTADVTTTDELGQMAASLNTSIGNLRTMHEALNRQARFDSLTGLPNRASLGEMLTLALSTRERATTKNAILFIDLDGFKLVNDSWGHAAGDELLVQAAARLSDALRGGDVVARMGGDEFVVLCGDVDSLEVAQAVANRIAATLSTPFRIGGQDAVVGASIGIALADADSTSEELLRQADVAMYQAKANGKSQYAVYDLDMQSRVDGRLVTENALRNAIEGDELLLHFQPVRRLSDDAVISVEALARWDRPGHGLLLPAEFIAVAEETNLINRLDAWVVRAACLEAATWSDTSVSISVNLSSRDLQNDFVVDAVEAALAESGLEPGRLILELTESMLISARATVTANLNRIQALGVQLAIDDFGTGYSSMAYLRDLQATIVKIDRSFVSEMDLDAADSAIASAIITMGHALGLQVVAEGVERDGQNERLRELGCDSAQGYFFARPMPSDELRALLGHAQVSELSAN